MKSAGTVTNLILEMRRGSDRAVELLWQHYQRPLRAVLKRRLFSVKSRAVDDEDVAINAFHSFLRRSRGGAYPDVECRDQAWRLLMMIALRKAINHSRREQRVHATWRIESNPQQERIDESEVVDQSVPPDLAVMFADSLEHLLSTLEDEEFRQVAMAKLAGYSIQEIADAIGKSRATVERRLRMIRQRWQADYQ